MSRYVGPRYIHNPPPVGFGIPTSSVTNAAQLHLNRPVNPYLPATSRDVDLRHYPYITHPVVAAPAARSQYPVAYPQPPPITHRKVSAPQPYARNTVSQPPPPAPLRSTSSRTIITKTNTSNMSSSSADRATSASPSTSRKAAKASASASAPSSRPPTRSSDPYYGHEETAVLCARFITSLFQCPNIPTATAPGAPTPTLAHFVAYALHRTRLPSIVTFAALLLLQRLKIRFPAARGSSGHRLFISAFMIASKVICDDTYSNQSWGIVAQKMFALKEINQMEREMCGYLEWNLNVGGDEVLDFEARVRAEHGPKAVAKAAAAAAAASSSSLDLPLAPSSAAAAGYPSPDSTPDSARPIRPVPAAYRHKPSASASRTSMVQAAFPSPPQSPEHVRHHHQQQHHAAAAAVAAGHYHLGAAHASPQPPHFSNSANSSLASSPASDDCKTPSPVAVTSAAPPPGGRGPCAKSAAAAVDMTRAFDPRRPHAPYPINVGGW